MANRHRTWYVEATGHTNEVIAAGLPAENAHPGVLCIDGEKRDLWECEYSFITKLRKNERVNYLKFKVFYRDGKGNPVREWPYFRKKRSTKALKEAMARKGQAAPRAGG